MMADKPPAIIRISTHTLARRVTASGISTPWVLMLFQPTPSHGG